MVSLPETLISTYLHCGILVPAAAAPEAFPIVDPALDGKVGGLGHVEAVVEAGMVGVGEHDDHVPLLLDHLLNLHHQHKVKRNSNTGANVADPNDFCPDKTWRSGSGFLLKTIE